MYFYKRKSEIHFMGPILAKYLMQKLRFVINTQVNSQKRNSGNLNEE